MDCKKKCLWNYDGTCVYEDEQKYLEGKPDIKETCPNWLREDFEEHFKKTHYKIIELLNKRNCEELEAIEKFILNQKEQIKNRGNVHV